jgi:hypothetical protein
MRALLARSVLFAGLLAVAPAAMAFQLPFDSRLSIRFLSMPALESEVQSNVGQLAIGPGNSLQSLRLTSEGLQISASVGVGPLGSTWTPIDGLFGTFGIIENDWTGLHTFARTAGGNVRGTVPLGGVVRVCLFSPTGCPGSPTGDVFIPLFSFVGSTFPILNGAVGWRGTWTSDGGFPNLTVRGAPWTDGTAEVGTISAMGFAMGPALQQGSTVRDGGRLNLVTPIFISSSIPAYSYSTVLHGIATLDITFTADPSVCDNGLDDDGDGLVDTADPACASNPTFTREDTQCQNGLDDDGDGRIDYDGGASLFGTPIAPLDPQCTGPQRNRETPTGCGLGAEVALALAGVGWLCRRRGRREA